MRRVCPFCGVTILLNRCSIYATEARETAPEPPVQPDRLAAAAARRAPGLAALAEFDGPDDLPRTAPPARTRPAARHTPEHGRDLLWSPRPRQAPEPVSRGRWFTQSPAAPAGEAPLIPLQQFPPQRLARRFCSNPACDRALPLDLDERQAHIIAIVGLNGAGKTYYIATAFSEAVNGDGLDAAGFREFELDDETASRFHQDYYAKVYRDRRRLEQTPERRRSELRPLNFRARIDGGRPMLVMTHDIAGETLVNHEWRARDAGFLRRASGVIFLVDPVEFDAVRDSMPADELQRVRNINQRDLLSATLRELEYEPGRQKVPVAVVVSKADLIARFLTPLPARSRARTEQQWLHDMQQNSGAVRDTLLHLGQQRLVRTAEEYGRITFHAVSALGGRLGQDGETVPRPQRVLDPLAVVLWRLSAALR
ncbi:TRAFAC clade GTPase domain-containing protein [Dactylosporangium sp. CS-033363]|uniref:TRAFAC clade GTPase domain-containing protein n=1 Tax=Dactylosporangium sp. CS-033363 TaxID=3239935 RepID=UPI003D8E585A